MSLFMFQSPFHAKCVYVNVPNTNGALIIYDYFSFFLFFSSYIAQHSIFLTLPESKKETISLPPTSLFLFLLIQEGTCSESVRTIVLYSSLLLSAAHVRVEALFSMRKDISLYSTVSQLLCWPYVFFPLKQTYDKYYP